MQNTASFILLAIALPWHADHCNLHHTRPILKTTGTVEFYNYGAGIRLPS
jgi:hypothetical protein